MSFTPDKGRVVGRYVLYDEIASGGMATIHLGRLLGQVGFARTVAIKRLHPHVARDPEFVAMFIDEARLAAGVRHPNVVSTLDVVALEGELFLVMEYVEGESFSHLLKAASKKSIPITPPVVSSIVSNVLYGLHAAHVAKDDRGEALHIVHRDVSPQNVLVGIDGIARVVDFGVAKASRRILETEGGRLKGKFRYMAPEQIRHDKFDHRIDVFAAGTMLWEALTGAPLFAADEPMRTMNMIIEHEIVPPTQLVPELPAAIDAVLARALARDPADRYPTARKFAIELEKAIPPAVPRVVGDWVEELVGPLLERRAKRLHELGSVVERRASPTDAHELLRTPSSSAIEVIPSAPPRSGSEPSLSVAPLDDDGVTNVMEQGAESEPEPSAPAQAVSAESDRAPEQGARQDEVQPVPALLQTARMPSVSLEQPPVSDASSSEPLAVLKTPPDSQVSDVSTASWDTPKRSLFPPAPGLPVMAGLAAGLALLLVAGAALLLIGRKSGGDEAPGSTARSAPAVGARAAPTPASPPAAAKPTVAAAPPSAPEPAPAETSAAPLPTARAEPKTTKPKPGAQTAPPAPPSAAPPIEPRKPASDCNPPWTIDKNGIKKFKRHCT